jgi:nitroreductase
MPLLDLDPDELLSTTRAVRRRLDLTRPVGRDVVEECVRLAIQAPTSTNAQNWHFVLVTDAATRLGLAELYRRSWSDWSDGRSPYDAVDGESRAQATSRYLATHIEQVPVHVIPCIDGRPEGMSPADLAALYGSIVQAGWSFQLAARARGLGGVWTTHHLDYEREAAELLGIDVAAVTQVALLPLAYTVGTDFRPAPRRPLETVVHWERW